MRDHGDPPVGASLRHDPRPSRARKAVAAALVAGMSGVLPLFLTGALAPLMGVQLGLTAALLGMAAAAFNLSLSLGAVTLGRWADRIGWQTSMQIAGVLSFASLMGIATLAQGWLSLAAFLLVGGLAHAIGQPAANLAIISEVEHSRQGIMFGIKQSAPIAAVSLSGLSVPLIALRIGWRWPFIFAASISITTVLLAMRLPTIASPRSTGLARPRPDGSRSETILLAGAGATAGATVVNLSTFLVSSLSDSGLSAGRAGAALAMASATGILVRLAMGWIVSNTQRNLFTIIAVMLAGGALGHVGLALHSPMLGVLASLLAFGAGYGWPGIYHFAVSSRDPGGAGGATGIAVAGLSAGSLIGPIIFGAVASNFGYRPAWLLNAALCLIAAILMAMNGRLHAHRRCSERTSNDERSKYKPHTPAIASGEHHEG